MKKDDRHHSYRMCKLTEQADKFNLEKIKKLTSNPKFICKHCGRKANNKENLCKPVSLVDDVYETLS